MVRLIRRFFYKIRYRNLESDEEFEERLERG